jgi:hypothetical protein
MVRQIDEAMPPHVDDDTISALIERLLRAYPIKDRYALDVGIRNAVDEYGNTTYWRDHPLFKRPPRIEKVVAGIDALHRHVTHGATFIAIAQSLAGQDATVDQIGAAADRINALLDDADAIRTAALAVPRKSGKRQASATASTKRKGARPRGTTLEAKEPELMRLVLALRDVWQHATDRQFRWQDTAERKSDAVQFVYDVVGTIDRTRRRYLRNLTDKARKR